MADSVIEANVAVLDSLGDIDKGIMDVLKEEVAKVITEIMPPIKEKVSGVVRQAVRNSPEWNSLIAGELREQLGLADAEPVLESILNTIIQNIRVEQAEPTAGSMAGIVIKILEADFSDILSLPGTTYVSVNRAGRQSQVPWLQWLLFAGDSVILLNTSLNRDRPRATSRTGSAIMVRTTKARSGWRIPPEYAGYENNNFLTRSLEGAEQVIQGIVEDEISRKMG